MNIDKQGGKTVKEQLWKYTKPLKDKEDVKRFLLKYKVELPEKLVTCLTLNNGGRPACKVFKTDKENEYVFNSLFSYNEGDSLYIGKVYPSLFKETNLFPIGYSSSGNFICYDTFNKIYILLNHETNAKEIVLESQPFFQQLF